MICGIEKFRRYAKPRGFYIRENSYGIYTVCHKGQRSQLEAVRAARSETDGTMTKGWIINIAGRQRTFKPDNKGWHVFPLAK